MEIKSLAETHFDLLIEAFGQAFADYEVQLDGEQLRRMLRRRGFDARLSFAAFEGDRIVSFTLNGVGLYNGELTAYDTGTGTLEEFRGKGLATRIFEYAVPHLRRAGVGQYLLEVLQHNDKAVSVYRNLGFETSREFNYYVWEKSEVRIPMGLSVPGYCVRSTDIRNCASASGFSDFRPSWQNSFESVERATDDFVSLGVFSEDRLVGYCIFEPASGDVTQLAVDRDHRRKGIGSLLLSEAIRQTESERIKIINTDIACNAMSRFLEARRIPLSGRQFEMLRRL